MNKSIKLTIVVTSIIGFFFVLALSPILFHSIFSDNNSNSSQLKDDNNIQKTQQIEKNGNDPLTEPKPSCTQGYTVSSTCTACKQATVVKTNANLRSQ